MIRILTFLLIALPGLGTAQTVTSAGRIIVEAELPDVGGLSGIEVFADGSFIAISDRGKFLEGTISRIDGNISGVALMSLRPILDSKGQPLDARNIDAEGLAVSDNGEIYVSFESNSRVMLHTDLNSAAIFLPKHDDFRTLQNNSGLEALAINAGGILLAIPERSGLETRPFPVYAFDGTIWEQTASVPRVGEFLVTGADFGPDGRLYLLERSYKWPAGFSARIRRFTYVDGNLGDEETLLVSHTEKLDNMEGISVWSDSSGQTRMTLVSDDNFFAFQRTVIAEYLVND